MPYSSCRIISGLIYRMAPTNTECLGMLLTLKDLFFVDFYEKCKFHLKTIHIIKNALY